MLGSSGKLTTQAPGALPVRPINSVPLPTARLTEATKASLTSFGRRLSKVSAQAQNSSVNAATLETTETDLTAELKEVLSKVKPKV